MHDVEMRDAGRSVYRERFEVSQKERRVVLLRTMIRDFENMIFRLDKQITTEEDRTKVKDPAHPAYSTLALAAAKRRQNLLISLSQVKAILDGVELREPALDSNSPVVVSEAPSV
jgi:flagellar protein FliJ